MVKGNNKQTMEGIETAMVIVGFFFSAMFVMNIIGGGKIGKKE